MHKGRDLTVQEMILGPVEERGPFGGGRDHPSNRFRQPSVHWH